MLITYTLREIPPIGVKSGKRLVGKGKMLAFNTLRDGDKARIMAFHQFKPDGELFEEYRQRTIFGTIQTVTVMEGHLSDGREAVMQFTVEE